MIAPPVSRTYLSDTPQHIACGVAWLEITEQRYQWRRDPDTGAAVIRYLPPGKSTHEQWTPSEGELRTLRLAGLTPPEEWSRLPVMPPELIHAGEVYGGCTYLGEARDLAIGYRLDDGRHLCVRAVMERDDPRVPLALTLLVDGERAGRRLALEDIDAIYLDPATGWHALAPALEE